MDTKNTNNNTNNVSVKVDMKQPVEKSSQKKSTPNWYVRTIIGGVIGLALSLCGYYLKKNMDDKPKAGGTLQSNENKINPN